MKIWGAKSMGNPVRVAIFVEEKGIDIPFIPVDLFNDAHKSKEHLAKNPAAQVPVLELQDGTCISETIAICRYLERLHPNPPLMGKDPLDEARVEMWQRRIEFGLFELARHTFRHSNPMVKKLEPVQVAEWAELNRTKIPAALEMLEPQLKANAFVAGPNFTVADITAVLPLQLMGMIGIEIPASCPSVTRWRDALFARPSVVAVTGQ
jgi:glutathione S-transferase